MQNEVVQVGVVAVVPTNNGAAVFLGDGEKVMVIHMEAGAGNAISMFLNGAPKERPLTHDLIALLLESFGAHVERVVINDFINGIYFARLIVSAENELHARKIVEIDARPSDSIALAIQQQAPIFVARNVWEDADDMSEVLAKLGEQSGDESGPDSEEDTAESAEDDDSEEDDDDTFGDDADDGENGPASKS